MNRKNYPLFKRRASLNAFLFLISIFPEPFFLKQDLLRVVT